jgi:hypothetical protein
MANERSSGSIIGASVWMVVVTVALFFLPLINGLVGGGVGGYRAGGVKPALIAAVLPAVVASVAIWGLIAALGAPVLGFFGGTAVGLMVLLADVGIFAGAAVGGWLGRSRSRAGHAH